MASDIYELRVPEWHKQAACNTPEGYLLFDFLFERPNNKDPLARARENYCDGCPVRQLCLASAMEAEGSVTSSYRFGVFAGKTPQERAADHNRPRKREWRKRNPQSAKASYARYRANLERYNHGARDDAAISAHERQQKAIARDRARHDKERGAA